MSYAIVYSSNTGNTRLLAETVRDALPGESCIYFGAPNAAALDAERIYLGFWTDKGSCDEASAAFLRTITTQEVFLFGTAGFGGQPAYFDQILDRTAAHLSSSARIIGRFMCQGKMPMSVRKRYEAMLTAPTKIPNLQGMIENFDRALCHPDQEDLDSLRALIPAES